MSARTPRTIVGPRVETVLTTIQDLNASLLSFCRHIWNCQAYLALCFHFCRTDPALSDISFLVLLFLSDKSIVLSEISCNFCMFFPDTSSDVGEEE